MWREYALLYRQDNNLKAFSLQSRPAEINHDLPGCSVGLGCEQGEAGVHWHVNDIYVPQECASASLPLPLHLPIVCVTSAK